MKKCSDCGGKLPNNPERYGKRCIRCHVQREKFLSGNNRAELKRRLAR